MKKSVRSAHKNSSTKYLEILPWLLYVHYSHNYPDKAAHRPVHHIQKPKIIPAATLPAPPQGFPLASLVKPPKPPHHKRTALIVFACTVLVVIVQLAYPNNRALPFSRLEANGFVGFDSEEEIAQKFQDFDTRTVTVHTHNKILTTSYADLGVTPRLEATFGSLSSYSKMQRMIPFSLLVVGNKTYSIRRDLNESQIQLYARDVIAETNKQPKDAGISIEDSKLVVSPSEEGYEYQASYLKSQVLKSDLQDKGSIVFAPTILSPKITTEAAEYAVSKMQQRIDTPINLRAEDKSMTIESKTIAGWVEIAPKVQDGGIELTFNKAKVSDSLRPFATQVDARSIPTVITLLNGMEAGRAIGTQDKVLQFDELVDKVSELSNYPLVETVEAKVTTTPPKDTTVRRYTRDSTGMQNLLNYWSQNHKGQYSVDFRTQNGRIEANINPYRSFPAIGIYRLFLAHTVYGRINARTLSGGSRTTAGYNVDSCLNEMMLNSNEACSAALGDIVGWSTNDDMLRAQGFENTTLLRGAPITTANDTSDWLLKLLEGSIATGSQSVNLADMMKRQVSRAGIPAGSRNIPVANKPGAYGGWVHDAGIVYHPKSTYVLSIFSAGGSYTDIADLTSEINKVISE